MLEFHLLFCLIFQLVPAFPLIFYITPVRCSLFTATCTLETTTNTKTNSTVKSSLHHRQFWLSYCSYPSKGHHITSADIMGRPIPLTYTRPKHVSQHSVNRQQSRSSTESEGDKASGNSSEGSVKSGRSGLSAGIPESLTFDKIVNSGTCPVSLNNKPHERNSQY